MNAISAIYNTAVMNRFAEQRIAILHMMPSKNVAHVRDQSSPNAGQAMLTAVNLWMSHMTESNVCHLHFLTEAFEIKSHDFKNSLHSSELQTGGKCSCEIMYQSARIYIEVSKFVSLHQT